MDNMYQKGSKPINTITVSPGIIEYIEGYSIIEINKIIIMDHCLYLVDINFKNYFQEKLSLWDNMNRRIIDPLRRSH